MAEHVHHNLEGMLPEFEEMERLNVFSRHEIRTIIKKRTDFEYRLQKRAPEKQDFIRYIQYELNLDALKKKRKLNIGIKKTTKGEYEMTRRLHVLFKQDTKLWLQYIEFCKKVGHIKCLSKVFGQLLQFHPHNTAFWVMAAKWEFEDNRNIPAARTLLQRALRMNAESKLLWLEYFRMELLHVDKVKKRRSVLGLAGVDEDEDMPATDAFLSGKAAEIVYRKAIMEVPDDFDFRLSFIKIYRLFESTRTGQDLIFESLKNDFGDKEEYWNALGCRPIDDAICNKSQESDIITAEKERDRIFTEATAKIPTEKMWDYYIIAVSSDKDTTTNDKVEKCLDVCGLAKKNGLLSSQSLKIMKSLHSHWTVRETMKERYIDWLVCESGIIQARQVYQRFCKESSVSLTFLKKCVSLELSQLPISIPRIRHLYDVMLDRFGQSESDCWIDYIRFELQQGRIDGAGKLHWKAMKSLTGIGLEDFVTKYSLLQAGHSTIS